MAGEERQRINDSRDRRVHWKRWGPYLSERAWGTVREDYSADGAAWDYFPHDHARYFDIFVEYAKAGPEDICVLITAVNRGTDAAELHLLPTIWFRNTWSWGRDELKPCLRRAAASSSPVIELNDPYYGSRFLH